MRTYIFLLVLLCTQATAIAQIPYSIPKHNDTWILTKSFPSDFAEPCALKITFENDQPLIEEFSDYPFYNFYYNTPFSVGYDFNSVTLSKENGDLDFYFTERSLFNADNQIIENGNEILDTLPEENYQWVQNFPNQIVGLAAPGQPGKYYMFFLRVTEAATEELAFWDDVYDLGLVTFDKFYYALIDMNQNNGAGKAMELRQSLVEDTLVGYTVAICRHANGRDWWLLPFEHKPYLSYYRFLVTPEGIVDMGKYVNTDILYRRENATIKFTNDGSKMVSKHSGGACIYTFDFDRCNGVLSNKKYFNVLSNFVIGTESTLAISPNGRYLYSCQVWDTIFQYDLEALDIESSKTFVLDGLGVLDSNGHPALGGFFGFHDGPDGKIYITAGNSNHPYLHVINRPNLPGLACNAVYEDILLNCDLFTSYQNLSVNYNIGPLDGSGCDTLGIDNVPIAKFRWYAATNNGQNGQFDNLSMLNPETYYWDFGDGTTSTEESPNHNYATKLAYLVCLTASNANGSDTYCETIYAGVPVGTSDEHSHWIKIGPNPAQEYIQVQLQGEGLGKGEYQLMLYDVQGRLVKSTSFLGHFAYKTDISSLPAGIYNCQIVYQNKPVLNRLITKIQ